MDEEAGTDTRARARVIQVESGAPPSRLPATLPSHEYASPHCPPDHRRFRPQLARRAIRQDVRFMRTFGLNSMPTSSTGRGTKAGRPTAAAPTRDWRGESRRFRVARRFGFVVGLVFRKQASPWRLAEAREDSAF
jgi:hypothetical protein